jgi:hypothetical protein
MGLAIAFMRSRIPLDIALQLSVSGALKKKRAGSPLFQQTNIYIIYTIIRAIMQADFLGGRTVPQKTFFFG